MQRLTKSWASSSSTPSWSHPRVSANVRMIRSRRSRGVAAPCDKSPLALQGFTMWASVLVVHLRTWKFGVDHSHSTIADLVFSIVYALTENGDGPCAACA